MTNEKINNMKRLLIGLLLLTSCSKEQFYGEPKRDIEFNIDSRLPKDANGYSVFTLYSDQTQNIHRISGSIRLNGKIPNEPRERIEWKSSHYWILKEGDTVATISKTYLNQYTGLFTIVQLPALVSNITAMVPTINPVSYNSSDGTVSTVIAPLWEMRGDTMTITAKIGNIIKIEKIILK